MITRLTDGFTLQYTDTDGSTKQVGMLDPNYLTFLDTENRQLKAQHDNAAAITGYAGALQKYQDWLNAGSIGPGPGPLVKPLMTVITDLGAQSQVPFVPPLPDPVQPTFAPSTGSIKATTAPPDRLDLILQVLQSLLTSVAAIKAKVGA